MLVILPIAADMLLTLMGIRHIEGPYCPVRSSDQGKNYKAFLRPDCRSLLLKQSLSFAIINDNFFISLYSMMQTHFAVSYKQVQLSM